MFIIQEGAVRITKVVDGREVILAVLKKGDMFGEMALLENKPRSASAIAKNCLSNISFVLLGMVISKIFRSHISKPAAVNVSFNFFFTSSPMGV